MNYRPSDLDCHLVLDKRAMQQARWEQERKALLTAAYWAAVRDRVRLRERLRTNAGVMWPEMEPLGAQERIALIVQLRHEWGLPPDPRMRPAEGRPKVDAPDMTERRLSALAMATRSDDASAPARAKAQQDGVDVAGWPVRDGGAE